MNLLAAFQSLALALIVVFLVAVCWPEKRR